MADIDLSDIGKSTNMAAVWFDAMFRIPEAAPMLFWPQPRGGLAGVGACGGNPAQLADADHLSSIPATQHDPGASLPTK